MNDADIWFDERFLRKIERLSLVVHQRRAGQIKGERRSTLRGASVEFADYRDYVKGDDLRRVDWNIYARLERPFIKLFEEEQDLTVHVLLDASRSMNWGGSGQDDPLNKWVYARRTAAALGYMALSSGDRLRLAVLNEARKGFGPARGKGQILPLLRFLSDQPAAGVTNLNTALRNDALRASTAGRAGLVILISDMFSPQGYQDGLSALLSRGHEGILLHILSPEEADPPLSGDLKLVDVESGHIQEVTIDAVMQQLYRRRLTAWQDEIGRWCGQRGVAYVPINTAQPFDELILAHLRSRGLVK